MIELKLLTNGLLKSHLTDTLCDRGFLSGDADDAPVGAYIVRPEMDVINLPMSNTQGYLECVGGYFKRQLFIPSFENGVFKIFLRTRWYNNRWTAWKELQLTALSALGG